MIVTTMAAAGAVLIEPVRAGAALMPVLLLQLFAASSGFMVPARRGHYDLLLTHGEGRVRIALAHWLMSVVPGVICWLALGAVEATVAPGRLAILASGSGAAVFLVSTLPWAVTVTLPRFAGAIGWLLALAMVVAVTGEHSAAVALVDGAPAGVQGALAVLLYPPLLVGEIVTEARALLLAPALVMAGSAMACAIAWVDAHDIPLEAAQ
jgi:hypothetical protein